jgi:hypothetical protein
MKTVKTAKGRTLDMAALAAKHEKTRAVSNMNLNARGDIIDNRNQVTIPREKIAKEFYKDNVPGADSKNISIKEDEKQHVNIETKEPVDKQEKPKKPKVTEVGRKARTREDGTQYFEVEYSDGSMEDIEAK